MLRRSAQPTCIESIGLPLLYKGAASEQAALVCATHNPRRSGKVWQGSGSLLGEDGPTLHDLPVVIDRNIAELQEYELALGGAQEDPVIHL